MNLSACKAAIYNWVSVAAVASQTGTKVYWDNPDAPRPASPSVRLKIISGPTMVGMDEVLPNAGGSDAFEIRGSRSMTLSINCYGAAAQQLASDLQTSLSDPSTGVTLDAAGVSTTTSSEIRDVSALLETKTEQRFQFDVDMLVGESKVINPGAVVEAIGTGTVTGGVAPLSVPFDATYP